MFGHSVRMYFHLYMKKLQIWNRIISYKDVEKSIIYYDISSFLWKYGFIEKLRMLFLFPFYIITIRNHTIRERGHFLCIR